MRFACCRVGELGRMAVVAGRGVAVGLCRQ